MTTRHDWPAVIARLRRTPGRWVLLFPNHPARLATTIRLRRARALRVDDGRLEARITNKYTSGGGPKGDIWVRWTNGTTSD